MTKRYAVVLAAGQGTRMKSKLYKVLHPVAGRPMVKHVIDQINTVKLDEIVTVVGFGADMVKEQIGDESKFVIQEEQLGTGHAVLQAEDLLKENEGTTLVVCGDTPLITSETYQALFDHHEQTGAKATVLTAKAPNPYGYGRVIRNAVDEVERIVEQKDATEKELLVDEINTGTYCFDNQALFQALQNVSNDNAQGEYYLPDVIEILQKQGDKVSAFMTASFEETLGVNDRIALAEAEKTMKQRINEKHLRNGVAIIDPDNTYIEPDVEIEPDTIIHPGTILKGDTVIKGNAEIGPHSEVTNCYVGNGTVIKQSVASDSKIGNHVKIGPFAHIRPESSIGDQAKVGNFVEIKKTDLAEKSKVSHLSYIGDAKVGSNVNIGCGTITVNYDGKHKYLTTIEDDAFIGCNSNLIAPVTVGKGSYVAAGSTITKDVPEDSLSVARARQTNKEGYASKIKNRQKD
ncbi:bifunctional UDP-N-acetylglucosamine diphosphorylase/glucosamine-1-phosphate N-acetyltransferase GlmU [Virgibacillus sp. AGTR]|uniref:bifunctional UDP-N-acetylglucosamine diphosphorylase/glucosamine-1-phosphate N-acetyltransferase GlmU n=1 Tax=unclassified Virgibacillus TaxID=2620237 RepID=UPI001964F89E|nr:MULTISPECIES: bifunctional UDP-N-acetylglucosamine diphosphorylase/glucosamine-1-phosphate N-acetyltransferase GlmU [unclassified Virgibacillus]MCC2250591.1 bifunctional UDP-N-acetylglucosamine diphosphorylase/glucosamine-1-phosphate N-acetyltransferase GlmU [Virgibacillus sp. AGTR]MDY7045108.1 bifunctional UDP-N-acetylglucosamine diphosphorylase/glucosamine-1-phosphate N-acetyltransferase GlmU [Virgibacillus sp. M23]QRZ19091.1 bifunctional UDP-N-acetylglucosamine diphosphorylase/glucosamine-